MPDEPQEEIAPTPQDTMVSEPLNMPSDAPEASRDGSDPVPVKDDNGVVNQPESQTLEPDKTAQTEPNSEPVENSEPQTAQTPVIEPLVKTSLARELLIKARNAIQFRKRKKLDHVMSMFLKQSKITNDEVEKFLHVSDATATRYLSELEKEGKIKQSGKTGKGVSYSRI